ncbi:unnamed protein product [Prorocentrum cordatum]|uniref:Ion transport domain-containing protein n=1 Tax=Prorocentrum cordatum TaxID=2364126 RepID=A0ABN9SP11_9DINO|nr:unnamed protein product [Polarella glacialis]
MGSEGFTQLQLKQLRDVMQGTIEDFLRDVVRSEFEALRHTERRPGKRLTKGFLGTGSDSVNQGQDHSANLSPRHSSKSEARTSTSQMQRAPAKRVTPQRTRSSDQRWRDMVQNSSNVLSVANNMSYYEKLRLKAQRLIHKGSRFDAVVGFIIVANSVCIGIETQLRLEGDLPVHFAWFESFFLICFILELVVRWVADGVHNLKLKWFWFDVTLVLSGAVCSWILEPLEPVSNADDVPVISQVLTLRVLRLMRLVRAVRLIEQFRELWRLCCGLTKSVRTMLSVCLLVLVVVFVFACMGVEIGG